jgi:coenzyme F420 hydrogenase subunit beta
MKQIDYIRECCTGCGLCHSVNGVEFENDKRGFPIPHLKSIEGRGYESICPVFQYEGKVNEFKLWGEIKSAYSGYSNDPCVRHGASSGGALTELAIYLLASGTVDGVIHTGVSAVSPIMTETFCSTTKEDVISHMGSRYSISMPLFNIISNIDKHKRYAFIGKPCDVAALKRYMAKESVLNKQIIITMSFFCAGIPSIDANLALLERMGCHEKELKSFQYRGNGWPGYATAISTNGETYQIDYRTAWGDYLGRDVRNICRYCMDGIGELADIVCADLWYLDKNNKPDFSEHEGRNIIICRTDIANKVLLETVHTDRLIVNDYMGEMDKFYKIQTYQFERRVTMRYRILALKIFRKFAPNYDHKLLKEANKFATKEMNWKIFKGTVKRILKGKL